MNEWMNEWNYIYISHEAATQTQWCLTLPTPVTNTYASDTWATTYMEEKNFLKHAPPPTRYISAWA
jgi:hypothetical protein